MSELSIREYESDDVDYIDLEALDYQQQLEEQEQQEKESVHGR